NDELGEAITGGTFYNPVSPQFGAGFVGQYFFADLGKNWIHVFDPKTGKAAGFADNLPDATVDLDVDPGGNLYVLSIGAGLTTGGILKISRPAGAVPPAILGPSDQVAAVGKPATFTAFAAGSAPLFYQWQRNGVNIPGANGPTLKIPSVSASDFGASYRRVVAPLCGRKIGAAAPLAQVSPLVRGLFFDVLHRAAAPAGLASADAALARGASGAQLAAAFLGSAERRAFVVISTYLNLLGR